MPLVGARRTFSLLPAFAVLVLLVSPVRYRDIIWRMAQLVVRNLHEDVKRRLQRRAARNGRSMEEEVRDILNTVLRDEGGAVKALGSRLAARFEGLGLEGEIPEHHGEVAEPASFAR